MPLKGRPIQEDASRRKATETFSRLDRDFGTIAKTTETISFRVPNGEKTRLRLLFARHGMVLSEAVKAAVYRFAKEVENEKL